MKKAEIILELIIIIALGATAIGIIHLLCKFFTTFVLHSLIGVAAVLLCLFVGSPIYSLLKIDKLINKTKDNEPQSEWKYTETRRRKRERNE